MVLQQQGSICLPACGGTRAAAVACCTLLSLPFFPQPAASVSLGIDSFIHSLILLFISSASVTSEGSAACLALTHLYRDLFCEQEPCAPCSLSVHSFPLCLCFLSPSMLCLSRPSELVPALSGGAWPCLKRMQGAVQVWKRRDQAAVLQVASVNHTIACCIPLLSATLLCSLGH